MFEKFFSHTFNQPPQHVQVQLQGLPVVSVFYPTRSVSLHPTGAFKAIVEPFKEGWSVVTDDFIRILDTEYGYGVQYFLDEEELLKEWLSSLNLRSPI